MWIEVWCNFIGHVENRPPLKLSQSTLSSSSWQKLPPYTHTRDGLYISTYLEIQSNNWWVININPIRPENHSKSDARRKRIARKYFIFSRLYWRSCNRMLDNARVSNVARVVRGAINYACVDRTIKLYSRFSLPMMRFNGLISAKEFVDKPKYKALHFTHSITFENKRNDNASQE